MQTTALHYRRDVTKILGFTAADRGHHSLSLKKMLGSMPDELFRAAHFHNSASNSNIAAYAPRFYSPFGAGHKGIKPLMCKHNVVYDLLTLTS